MRKVQTFASKGLSIFIAIWMLPGLLGTQIEPLLYSFALADSVPTEHKLYVPLLGNTYDHTTIFGATLDDFSGGAGFYQITSTETSWTRLEYSWNMTEPIQGQRVWDSQSSMEDNFIQAADYDLNVILIIGDTPKWALKPGFNCGAVAPGNLAAFGKFVYDLVARYSVEPYHIKYWELWNEPDVSNWMGCWGQPGDKYYGGGYYGQMLKTAYPMIKAADPAAQVLVGGLLLDCDPNNPPADPASPGKRKDCTPARFLEGILANGAGNSFDGVSFHSYDFYAVNQGLGKYVNSNWDAAWNTTGPVLNKKADYLRGLLTRYKVPQKALINTELALLCDVCTTNSSYYADFEQTKANYIAQSYVYATSQGLLANIWYSTSGWRNSGLLGGGLKILPGFQAYSFASQTLSREILSGQVESSETGNAAGVFGFKFVNGNRKITWVIWSLDGNPHNIVLRNPPARVWDVLGKRIPVSGSSFAITIIPVYMQWNP